MSEQGFYRSFEDRHRGSRELIRGRLEAYLPLIEPLLGVYPHGAVLDLGCGRGEWLELLRDKGFDAHGVDMDEGMLSECTARGLSVEQGDALARLKATPDDSLCIVSGFHFVEHIPFATLDELVLQARRALKPGGLLILETPNPENLIVGSSSFYLDPTHVRPLPPLLLAFLPEYHRFARVQTLRLQEDPALRERADVSLMSVLEGVSPDYAIVAQKTGPTEILEAFDAAFETKHGLDLRDLADRFDRSQSVLREDLSHRQNIVDQRFGEIAQHVEGSNQHLATLNQRLSVFERIFETESKERADHFKATELRAEDLLRRLEERDKLATGEIQRLIEVARSLDAERNALKESLSWRVTAPARWILDVATKPEATIKRSANFALGTTINLLQKPLSGVIAAVLRKPGLSERLNHKLLRYPSLHRHLVQISQNQGVKRPSDSGSAMIAEIDSSLESLSPRARQIHSKLVQPAQENQKNEGSDAHRH